MKRKRKAFIMLVLLSAVISNVRAQRFEFLSDTMATESGLKYLIIDKGDGLKVALNKEVAFHWTGYFRDGSSFGTSAGTEPFYFITGKGQVIKGAEEGLALMHVGDRYLFIMPPELAYGEKGAGETIPPNATLIFDYQVVSVTEPKLSVADTLLPVIKKGGIEKGVILYHQLKKNDFDKYAFRESVLNSLGYQLLRDTLITEAIEIFKLNVQEYPESWNVYDSLGEAYLSQGNKSLALKNYQKSVELNPENEFGLEAIKKLKSYDQ